MFSRSSTISAIVFSRTRQTCEPRHATLIPSGRAAARGSSTRISEPVEERTEHAGQFRPCLPRQVAPFSDPHVADMRAKDLRHPIHHKRLNHRQALRRQITKPPGEGSHRVRAIAAENGLDHWRWDAHAQRLGQPLDIGRAVEKLVLVPQQRISMLRETHH